ncbi:hypothetical protein ES332_A07G119400v1 [Gossypium tomentosum]|uniref:Uncharacterized protein n=1 Tax=Gossypium tomentosum TaxID=34277 RepID=A0A5D2PV49_GOSTO|nr:hypothetical protein ES332_A07G119400v1 [Gossypium tomentosum]
MANHRHHIGPSFHVSHPLFSLCHFLLLSFPLCPFLSPNLFLSSSLPIPSHPPLMFLLPPSLASDHFSA